MHEQPKLANYNMQEYDNIVYYEEVLQKYCRMNLLAIDELETAITKLGSFHFPIAPSRAEVDSFEPLPADSRRSYHTCDKHPSQRISHGGGAAARKKRTKVLEGRYQQRIS
jgi:hypothetical protein